MLGWLVGRSRFAVLPITVGTGLWFWTPLKSSLHPVERTSPFRSSPSSEQQHSQWLRFWNNAQDRAGLPTSEDTSSGVMLMSADEEKEPQQEGGDDVDDEDDDDDEYEDESEEQGHLPPELDFRDMSYGEPNPDCPLKSDLREDEDISFEGEHPDLQQCAFCILFDKHTPCGHLFSAFKECSLQKIRRKRQARAKSEGPVQSVDEKSVATSSQKQPDKTDISTKNKVRSENEDQDAADDEEFNEEDMAKPDECMRPFIIFRKCMFHFPRYYSKRNQWLSGLYDKMELESDETDPEDGDDNNDSETKTPSSHK